MIISFIALENRWRVGMCSQGLGILRRNCDGMRKFEKKSFFRKF